MINILHFSGPMKRAGAETFIMNMMRSIDRSNFHFDFLCKGNEIGDYDDEIFSYRSKIYHISYNIKGGKLKSLYNYFSLRKFLKSVVDQYDIFHIHHYHAFDAYIAARSALDAGFKNVVIHCHSAGADGHFILHTLCKKMIHLLNITRISCSVESGRWMFNNDRFEIITNGVDTKKYKYNQELRNTYRKQFRIEDEQLVLGHVGRFYPVKNHVFIINVFCELLKRYPNSKLLLVGDGPTKESIFYLCREKKISDKVLFVDSVADTSPYYQVMDVFIMPSFYEGVSLSAIEAETSGLPCVFSENVSKDVDLSSNVSHIPLQESIDYWVDKIDFYRCKSINRETGFSIAKFAGYDIEDCSIKLMNLYKSIINKKNE